MKADPANRDAMTYEEDGGRHSIYFLRPKTRDDLQRRMEGHRRIADFTYGMFGRSPDHVASFVTGMAMKPDALHRAAAAMPTISCLLPAHPRQRHLRRLRRGAAAGRAQSGILSTQNIPVPTLRVVREDDDGVVISGMKMLATGALYRQRDLDRQRHPAGARPEEGGDHLRDPLQRAGPDAVVAQAARRPAAPRSSIRRSPGATTKATAC